jgi:hypothetical protein
MTHVTLDTAAQKKKMGFIPSLQPKWCKHCIFFDYQQKELNKNLCTDDVGHSRVFINQNCKKGGFPVRSNSSCNLFELNEP